MDLPVAARLPERGDDQFDTEFVVTVDGQGRPVYRGPHLQAYPPRFLEDPDAEGRRLMANGFPQLEYDVGLLARQPNPMNPQASVTVCTGIFSRGTYGIVRMFTDYNLRAANEAYLYEHFDPGRFWALIRVPMFQGIDGVDTITPALAREFHVLLTSEHAPS
jgi:hypothetical protein